MGTITRKATDRTGRSRYCRKGLTRREWAEERRIQRELNAYYHGQPAPKGQEWATLAEIKREDRRG